LTGNQTSVGGALGGLVYDITTELQDRTDPQRYRPS